MFEGQNPSKVLSNNPEHKFNASDNGETVPTVMVIENSNENSSNIYVTLKSPTAKTIKCKDSSMTSRVLMDV